MGNENELYDVCDDETHVRNKLFTHSLIEPVSQCVFERFYLQNSHGISQLFSVVH